MLETLRLILVAIIVCIYKNKQIFKLKERLEIKESENLSLKRVLRENDLIPKEYVK